MMLFQHFSQQNVPRLLRLYNAKTRSNRMVSRVTIITGQMPLKGYQGTRTQVAEAK